MQPADSGVDDGRGGTGFIRVHAGALRLVLVGYSLSYDWKVEYLRSYFRGNGKTEG